MRFQQLKRKPNSILRKKLYKSGKSWVIKSSLSFAGGLILFGATQFVNVSADSLDSVQTEQSASSAESQQNDTSKLNSNSNDNNSNEINHENSQQLSSAKTEQDNNQVESDTKTVVITNQNSNQTTSNTKTNVVTNQSNNQNDGTDSTSNSDIQSDDNNVQNQNVPLRNDQNSNSPVAQSRSQNLQISQAQSDKEKPLYYSIGSCDYYVKDGTLHIGAGDITQAEYDDAYKIALGLYRSNVFDQEISYDKISFDGKVTLHGNVHNFLHATSAKTIDNLENLDTSDVTDFSNFFSGSKSLQSIDLSKLNTSNATNLNYMLANCSSLTDVKFKDDLGNVMDTSKVKSFLNMFDTDASLKSLDLTGLDTSSATTMAGMFNNDTRLTFIDVSDFDTSKVTNMDGMFNSDGDKLNIKGLDKFDTSKVTNMFGMFAHTDFNVEDLKSWDTSKVEDISDMFLQSGLSGKVELPSFNGASLKYMSNMFEGANKVTEVDLDNLKTPMLSTDDLKVGENNRGAVYGAFKGCSNLQKVDLPEFSGENIENYSYMFSNCPKLTTIEWPHILTKSATSFEKMFNEDESLTADNLEFLSNFDTSKVTNFYGMFSWCTSLESLPEVKLWNMASANDLSYMFDRDTSLKGIDLSQWETNNVSDWEYFLGYCKNLTEFKLPIFDKPTKGNIKMGSMFTYCNNLHFLDFSNFNIPENTDRSGMFFYTNYLYKIKLNSNDYLTDSSLSFYDIYKGWYNVGTGTDDDPQGNYKLKDGTDMMKVYSAEGYNGAIRPNETWVIAERHEVNYKIEYVDFETGKEIYDFNSKNREGWYVAVPSGSDISVPGYDSSVVYDSKGDKLDFASYHVKTDSEQTGWGYAEKLPTFDKSSPIEDSNFTVKLKKSAPFTIKISDVPDEIVLQVNDPDAIKDNTILQSLNTVKELDPDKTTISIDSDDPVSETEAFGGSNPSKNIKDLVLLLIKSLGQDSDQTSQVITIPANININVSYKPNTGNDSTDNNNNSSSHSGGTTSNRTVTNINQTIATFSDRPEAQLYDFDGNTIDGKYLDVNTDWFNDKQMTLNGQTYYRVATDEWVKADQVYVYVEHISKVRTYKENKVQLINAHLDNVRSLNPSTDWETDRYVMFNGEKYYRVATNEFVPADKVYEYWDDSDTIRSKHATPIFDERGNDVGRTLLSNEDYKIDMTVQINNETYYRVATDEFVKKSDVI
ncbi:BspA family leucine-rich repeat surface protein [Companilactobacillus insicii]|uniref:BspA family leucine-rich repeat surface protein n=1 Tax=Companilactobacillus insicii TaxID=1732567 RepID=UPI000F7AA71D|nr:BspA family leucine-rich repeat surface protein [Companilactobacillus insicii]